MKVWARKSLQFPFMPNHPFNRHFQILYSSIYHFHHLFSPEKYTDTEFQQLKICTIKSDNVCNSLHLNSRILNVTLINKVCSLALHWDYNLLEVIRNAVSEINILESFNVTPLSVIRSCNDRFIKYSE